MCTGAQSPSVLGRANRGGIYRELHRGKTNCSSRAGGAVSDSHGAVATRPGGRGSSPAAAPSEGDGDLAI